MTSSSFQYGFLGAKDAEIMLRNFGIDRCFLVRKVTNSRCKERHILTFLEKNSVKHLVIPFNLRLKTTFTEDLETITNRLVKSFHGCMNPLKKDVNVGDMANDNDQKVAVEHSSNEFLVHPDSKPKLKTFKKEKGIPRIEQCYICELVGENAGQSDHQNKHRVCLCNLCDRYFGHKCFSQHRKRCSNAPENFMLCDLCDYRTRNKGHLKQHYKRHKENKSFECDKCRKVFQSEKRLASHNRVHKREDYKCTFECSYSSRKRSNFERHMLSHSTSRKVPPIELSCKECPYSTKSFYNVKRHSMSCKKIRAKPIIISMIEPGTLYAINSTHD